MRELLERLGNPQRAFASIHVVGTKGKSTAARRLAATIGGRAYTSPHVSGWHERLQTTSDGFERAIARVRPAAEELGATQFEILTAAAFADFAAAGVEAAAIEAGLGGRLDATNVIDARVVLLTNVGLEHTDVLGETREEIAREKLAVAAPGTIVVLPDEEFAQLASGTEVRIGGAREAAAAFLGRDVELADASLPGRFELRGRAKSGTARIRRRRRSGCSRVFLPPTTWSSPRSCATRTLPGSSSGSRAPGGRLSRPGARTTARSPPPTSLSRPRRTSRGSKPSPIRLPPAPERSNSPVRREPCSSPARSTSSPISTAGPATLRMRA